MIEPNKIHCGDTLGILKTFPDESVDCCVTSPPYWGLRDYGIDGQFGLEKTPEGYVVKMVEVFREVKRILKKEGTFWLNLGDTYNGNKKGDTENHKNKRTVTDSFKKELWNKLKPKDLIGIPWRIAFALQSDGWILRQDIIWHKPNPMPESVTDRCTKAHEYIFLLTKSQKYYFNNEAIQEKALTQDNSIRDRNTTRLNNIPGRTRMAGLKTNNYKLRNKRSVWTVNTKPFKGAHFATFPEELIRPCILAGCPPGGIVLDPFFGAGTTGLVAKKLGRNYIGIEKENKYFQHAKHRISQAVTELFV